MEQFGREVRCERCDGLGWVEIAAWIPPELVRGYLRYYDHGRAIEVSSGTDHYDEALALLRRRMANITSRENSSEETGRVRVGQLFDCCWTISDTTTVRALMTPNCESTSTCDDFSVR